MFDSVRFIGHPFLKKRAKPLDTVGLQVAVEVRIYLLQRYEELDVEQSSILEIEAYKIQKAQPAEIGQDCKEGRRRKHGTMGVEVLPVRESIAPLTRTPVRGYSILGPRRIRPGPPHSIPAVRR